MAKPHGSLRDKMKPERKRTAEEKAKAIMNWIEDRKLRERIFGEAAREAIASAHAAGISCSHPVTQISTLNDIGHMRFPVFPCAHITSGSSSSVPPCSCVRRLSHRISEPAP